MTKADLVTDLKNYLGPGVDVDATGLTTWLNDAYMYMVDEIVKAIPDYFTKTDHSSTISGQQEYTLPSDYDRMVMVNVNYGGVWRRVLPLPNINYIPVIEAANSPGFSLVDPRYYLYGRTIGFVPIPIENGAGNIKIWFVYNPAELSADSDIPAFPNKYHHLLKLGAKANYLGRDSEDAAGEALWARFEKRIEKMIETISDMQVDEPKSVTITSNYDLYRDNDYYV